jgi:ribosomal peptide maturation radical SAM protein 1
MSVQSVSFSRNPRKVARRKLRVAMVNMPWARVSSPSMQCGLLQAVVRGAGHECTTRYLNVEFAARLGANLFEELANSSSDRFHMVGEWLFSYAAFGDVRPAEDYLTAFPELAPRFELLRSLRTDMIPRWLAETAGQDWHEFDVIGFTSTFAQTSASFAMAKAIRERSKHPVFVFGGANFDGEMGAEFARTVAVADYVISGEAEQSFPALLNAIADSEEVAFEGLHRHEHLIAFESDVTIQLPPAPHLDQLPTPQYHEYFAAVAAAGAANVTNEEIHIPIEFSRGCWWGQHHHCTFCGLNSSTMAYRAKTPERAMVELETLASSYRISTIDAVDNILDLSYLDTLLPQLAARQWDLNLFLEVKASLTREDVALLRDAGIQRIQPGIESLSTNVLKLMRKGTNQLTNVRLLKWALYHGVQVTWNVLAGFPGETERDYLEQLHVFQKIPHLQPPNGCGRVWLERYSPFFADPSYQLPGQRPRACYDHIFPSHVDKSKIAYFFDYTPGDDTVPDSTIVRMNAAIEDWKNSFYSPNRASLTYRRFPGSITIHDTRSGEACALTLDSWHAAAYLACDARARTFDHIHRELQSEGHIVSLPELRSLLDRTTEIGLTLNEGDAYLGLALPQAGHHLTRQLRVRASASA